MWLVFLEGSHMLGQSGDGEFERPLLAADHKRARLGSHTEGIVSLTCCRAQYNVRVFPWYVAAR
jgi:hypothetical protein